MTEYIDREAVLLEINRQIRRQFLCIANVETIIKDAPAADVAPVVRCKDCKFYQNHGLRDVVFDKDACHWNADEQPDPDDFCSCGERRG